MRIGLVGYGFGGRIFHMPYIQAATEWELVGVVTRSPERQAEVEQDAPGVPTFDTLDDLIDAGVDAVTITTPPSTRRELVLRALERGVHVVADKPFAPNLEVAVELAAAAKNAGKVLTVFQNRRWDTDFVTLRNVIDEGKLGTPWRSNFVLDQDSPGTLEAGPGDGLLRDLGAHVVDQVIQLFGPVKRVDAHLDWIDIEKSPRDRDTDSTDTSQVDIGFSLGLHHESGVYSAVSSSKLAYRAERGMIVYGSLGSYTSRMNDVQVDQALAGERPATANEWGVADRSVWGTLSTADGQTLVPSAASDYTDYYRAFHATIADGAPLKVTLDEALHTIAVLDAARQSDAEGRAVTLD